MTEKTKRLNADEIVAHFGVSQADQDLVNAYSEQLRGAMAAERAIVVVEKICTDNKGLIVAGFDARSDQPLDGNAMGCMAIALLRVAGGILKDITGGKIQVVLKSPDGLLIIDDATSNAFPVVRTSK